MAMERVVSIDELAAEIRSVTSGSDARAVMNRASRVAAVLGAGHCQCHLVDAIGPPRPLHLLLAPGDDGFGDARHLLGVCRAAREQPFAPPQAGAGADRLLDLCTQGVGTEAIEHAK